MKKRKRGLAWLLCAGLMLTQLGMTGLANPLAVSGAGRENSVVPTATDSNADGKATSSNAEKTGAVLPGKQLRAQAEAPDTGDFVVTMDEGEVYEENDYTYDENFRCLTIKTGKHLTISGGSKETPVTGSIVFAPENTASPSNATLNNLTLHTKSGSPVVLWDDVALNLTLVGENELKAPYGRAGIYVPYGANLNIGGTNPEAVYTNDGGVLTVTGSAGAPGIGTTKDGDVGNIAITGVKVNATGAPGIGGFGYNLGTLSISGAFVTAKYIPNESAICMDSINLNNSLVEGDYWAEDTSLVNSITLSGTEYNVRGTYTLPFDWELRPGYTLKIGEKTGPAGDKQLIVPAGVTLTNNGNIVVDNNEATQSTGTLTMNGMYTGTGSVTGNGTVNGENKDAVPPLDSFPCGGWLVSPNTLVSGTDYTYDSSTGKFTLKSLPEGVNEVRIISKIPKDPTEQNLVINIQGTSEDAPVKLTLKDINLTPQQRNVPFELQNGHVILNLEGENAFRAADIASVSGAPSAGIVIKERASLEIVGGSLSVFGGGIGESNNPELVSAVINAAGGIELSGKLKLNAENVSICGGSVKNPNLDWGDSSSGTGGHGIRCFDDAALMIHSGTVEVKGGMANGKSEILAASGAGIQGGTITIQGGSYVTVAGGDASVSPAVNGKRQTGIGLQDVNGLKIDEASLTVQYGDPGEDGEIPAFGALQSNGGVTLSNQSFLYTQGLQIKNREDMEALQGEDCQIENSIAFVGEKGTNTGEVSGMVFGGVRLGTDLEIKGNEVLRILNGAVLTVPAGKTLTNNGTIIIEEGGKLVIEPMSGGGETGGETPGETTGGTVTNNGTIENNGTVQNDGTIKNENTITNNGTVQNDGTIENRNTIQNFGTLEGEKGVSGNPVIHESAMTLSIQNSGGIPTEYAAQGERVTLAGNVRKKEAQTAAFALLRAAGSEPDTVYFYQGDEESGLLLGTARPDSDGNAAITVSLTGENWPVKKDPYTITAVYYGSPNLTENLATASLLVTAVPKPVPGAGYAVDYEKETIRAFPGYEIRLMGAADYESGEASIEPGTTVFVRLAAADGKEASEETENFLPARPEGPKNLTAEAALGQRADGRILTGAAGLYQLRCKEETGFGDWKNVTADGGGAIGGLQAGAYQLRYPAGNGTFASVPTDIIVSSETENNGEGGNTGGEGGNGGGSGSSSDSGGEYEADTAPKKVWELEMETGAETLPETEGEWFCRPDGSWGMKDAFGQEIKESWVVSSQTWYYLDEAGVMAEGLKEIGGKYYDFRKDSGNEGKLLVGWILWEGKWYYGSEEAGSLGEVRFGWLKIRGKWYYFGADGVMLMNARTPDGYFVGADGAWIPGL